MAASLDLLTEADAEWGYPFGVDGLLSVEDACEFLGGVSRATILRKADDNLLRIGKHPKGRKLAICKRSILEYVRSMEK